MKSSNFLSGRGILVGPPSDAASPFPVAFVASFLPSPGSSLTSPERTLLRRFCRRRPLPAPSSSSSQGLGSRREGEGSGLGFWTCRRRLRRWRSRREGRPFFLRRLCGDGVSAGGGGGGGGGGLRVFSIGGRQASAPAAAAARWGGGPEEVVVA
uniref:Uncharacterized protein n=1 Tax=Arundo donax TaxID=35708 RepID=A0A0A9GUJ2_ARUDO